MLPLFTWNGYSKKFLIAYNISRFWVDKKRTEPVAPSSVLVSFSLENDNPSKRILFDERTPDVPFHLLGLSHLYKTVYVSGYTSLKVPVSSNSTHTIFGSVLTRR
jgi:hypothetical protein